MSSRFFSEEPVAFEPPGPTTARLVGAEAHHLLHVMRAGVGDAVTLFDGSGAEFACQITALGRSEVSLAVVARTQADREAPVAVTMGVAMPKGDRQKVLVEKLTEIGVARLVPLLTERSVAAPKAAAIDKLRRLVIEASKQCGRNRLMEIGEPTPLAEFFASCDAAGERIIAHPGAAPLPTAAASTRSAAIAVGPEGGFSDAEIDAAVGAGWRAAGLGARVLRVETAAFVLAASRATLGGFG